MNGKFKGFIITFALLLPCSLLIAQSYISIPDSGIIWRQTSIRFDQATTTQLCWDNQFDLRGEDTLINSLTYSKLYWSGFAGANGVCDLGTITNQNNWAIREDTAKRVYIFDYISGQEYLLYDFNLGLNDTLAYGNAFSFNGSYDNYVEVITSVDSLLIDGLYHKVCHITSNNWMGVVDDYVQIIDGIGSTFGLFADISPNWGEKYDLLNCVYINGQIVYSQTQPCSLLTSISELNLSNEMAIEIFPNPTSSSLTLQTSNNTVGFEYCISDLLGKTFLKGIIPKSHIEFTIDLNRLNNGIYILKIFNNSSSKIFKFSKRL
ncbi:MAG: T9SS type A sorting domain-containing protein [Bacteroidota bacterium]|nr:T9SS type A sorting domain-containing protein [Bacteroidota bacterium]